MVEEEEKTEIRTDEPPEAVKQILRSFGRAGGGSAESKFAYTLNIPGVCMVSFVCAEDNAKTFIKAARKEAMALIDIQMVKIKAEPEDAPDGDGPPPNSYYG